MEQKKQEEGITLMCRNYKCLYAWKYKGVAMFYTSCPRCKTPVKIVREKTL